MKNLGALSALQFNALMNPVETQDQLQNMWKQPKTIKQDNKRMWLAVLVVAKNGDKYSWTAGLRLYNTATKKLKFLKLWSFDERLRSKQLLSNMLNGVGDPETDDKMVMDDFITIMRDLTGDEFSAMVRPALLNVASQGKNGNKFRSNEEAGQGADDQAGLGSRPREEATEIREQED